jgi:predicted membrane-bound spermidine synthase
MIYYILGYGFITAAFALAMSALKVAKYPREDEALDWNDYVGLLIAALLWPLLILTVLILKIIT